MKIKTTRDLGVWFTNIRECKNDVIMSNPINCKTLDEKWVLVESLKFKMREILHHFHDVENLDSASYQQYYEMLREELEKEE